MDQTLTRPPIEAACPARPGPRSYGAVNWVGLWTLCLRETRRFWKVGMQTLFAPVVSSLLMLFVFKLAFNQSGSASPGGRQLRDFPCARRRHDGDPQQRLRQHVVFADHRQGAGQFGRLPDAAPVAARAHDRLPVRRGDARHPRRHRHLCRHLDHADHAVPDRPSLGGALLLRRRLAVHGRDRPDRRHLGRQVRPHGCCAELRRHAAHHAVGHLLSDQPAGRARSRRSATPTRSST